MSGDSGLLLVISLVDRRLCGPHLSAAPRPGRGGLHERDVQDAHPSGRLGCHYRKRYPINWSQCRSNSKFQSSTPGGKPADTLQYLDVGVFDDEKCGEVYKSRGGVVTPGDQGCNSIDILNFGCKTGCKTGASCGTSSAQCSIRFDMSKNSKHNNKMNVY